jgi:hypothetical protein
VFVIDCGESLSIIIHFTVLNLVDGESIHIREGLAGSSDFYGSGY